MKYARGLLLLLIGPLLLTGCICSGNQEAIRTMRALPKERLTLLYKYVKSVDARRNGGDPTWMDFAKQPVPKEIADLHPKSLVVDGDLSRIHLSGCVDDKVHLFFHGLESAEDKKEIILTLGEQNGYEVLWNQ